MLSIWLPVTIGIVVGIGTLGAAILYYVTRGKTPEKEYTAISPGKTRTSVTFKILHIQFGPPTLEITQYWGVYGNVDFSESVSDPKFLKSRHLTLSAIVCISLWNF